jgi:hypothetical protein
MPFHPRSIEIAPLPYQFFKHSWCHSISPNNLELSGVVSFAQDENTRLYSELIAGIARKSNAIWVRLGQWSLCIFQYSITPTFDVGGSLRYKSSSSFCLDGFGICSAIPVRLLLLRILSIYPIFIGSGLGDCCATRPNLGLYSSI